jgi:hypothetical protein
MMLREVSPSSGNHDVNVGACLDRHDKVRDVRCWQWGIEPKDEARPTVSDVANVIRDFGVDFLITEPAAHFLHFGKSEP